MSIKPLDMVKNSIPLYTMPEASLPLIHLWNVGKFLKGILRSILPEFSLVLCSYLMLRVTTCLETHRTCFIFELAWCWGFPSCNIYHHAEVFGLHETANAERASAGSADISASVTQAWQQTAQSQRWRGVSASSSNPEARLLRGSRAWNSVLSSDRHTPRGMWLSQGPSFPSVRRERNGIHSFVQCPSPTGMENTKNL